MDKFVVLHTLVEDWPQGTVVTREQLRTRHRDDPDKVVHDAHDRLLALGAIRPVREGEEGLGRVPVPAGGLSTEAQLKLGQLDATLDQLARAVAARQERLDFHERHNPAVAMAAEEDPAVAAAIAERQARVDLLTAQFEAQESRLAELQAATAAADQGRAKAAHEARGGREMPTGQAGALGPPVEQHAGAAGAGEAGPSPPAPSPPPSPSPPPPPAPRRGRPSRQAEPTPTEAPKEPEPGSSETLFPPKE
jgi:hypothetical protein